MRKILLRRFKQPVRPFNILTVHKGSDTGLFRDLNNPACCNLNVQNEISSDTHLFFESISNIMYIPEMQERTGKIFFGFQINAFEFVGLDNRFY